MVNPERYRPEWIEEGAQLCREKGYTSPELASHFNVDRSTLYRYFRVYPEFYEAIREAKDQFDAEVVEQKLLDRVMGYTVKEVRDDGGKTTTTTKELPPDVTACIYWLKNRQPQRWRDRQEIAHEVDEGLAERILRARKREAAEE